jgi:hypothetical protein
MTMTIARLNIQIPINKKKRYAQQAGISNSLVTVFAIRHLDKLLITEKS